MNNALLDNARSFAEGGYSYTGEEVRLWVYKLCDEIERLRVEDASLTKAYAEGREDERRYAQARLTGWIQCAEEHGVPWSGTEADSYTMAKYGDRPMCCGVLL